MLKRAKTQTKKDSKITNEESSFKLQNCEMM